jgi:hypothetical protein
MIARTPSELLRADLIEAGIIRPGALREPLFVKRMRVLRIDSADRASAAVDIDGARRSGRRGTSPEAPR